MNNYNQKPLQKIETTNNTIACFDLGNEQIDNIDLSVVESFGNEWIKFHGFKEDDIIKISETYFDIIDEKMINKETYLLDAGCGSGRFSKYMSNKVKFIEAIDPSNAVYAADKLLEDTKNIRISKASINNIPFEDETFDFVMSIGVLHHIPNTLEAMQHCVKKVKKGGYFYTYLYYNLENRNLLFKIIYYCSTILRKIVSIMPQKFKAIICDILAILLYMPFIITGRFLKMIGLKKIAEKLPLSYYQNQTFLIIRNDALDRFGTTLEQRFSKSQITEMMTQCGLKNIIISPIQPYWHAVGEKI